MILLFLGASGSGKDTQADLLVERYGYDKVGSGYAYREFVKNYADDPLAKKAKKLMDQGIFPDDKLTYGIFSRYVHDHPELIDSDKTIFIAFVRRISQAPVFDQFLKKLGKKLDYTVIFDLDEKAAVERLSQRRICPKCGENYHLTFKPPKKEGICDKDGEKLFHREDDQPAAIKVRHQQYYELIKPILEYYQKQGKLIRIDAAPSIAEIQQDLVTRLRLTK